MMADKALSPIAHKDVVFYEDIIMVVLISHSVRSEIEVVDVRGESKKSHWTSQ